MTVRAVNVLGIEWGRRSASVVVGEERVLQKTKKKADVRSERAKTPAHSRHRQKFGGLFPRFACAWDRLALVSEMCGQMTFFAAVKRQGRGNT